MKLTNFVRLEIKAIVGDLGLKRVIGVVTAWCMVWLIIEYIGALIFIATNRAPMPMMPAISVVFTIILVAFPFFPETRNDINAFYVTQNIPRKTVVSGTYLYTLFANILYTAVVFIIESAVSLAVGNLSDIKTRLIFIGIMFIMMELGVAVNYPIYFRRGYSNGIFIATLVSFIIPCVLGIIIGVLVLFMIIDFSKIQDTGTIIMLFGAAILLTVLFNYISLCLSKKNYARRDL
jgi:hypothetical protein